MLYPAELRAPVQILLASHQFLFAAVMMMIAAVVHFHLALHEHTAPPVGKDAVSNG